MNATQPLSASPWSSKATYFLFHPSALFLLLEIIPHEQNHVIYHLLLFSKSFLLASEQAE